MSEKKEYSLLPTTASGDEVQVNSAITGPSTTPSGRLLRNLLKAFKLSVLVAVLVFIFFPSGDDNDKSFPRHERHGPHGDKKKLKYTFETHMQTDVNSLVTGSLESRYSACLCLGDYQSWKSDAEVRMIW